ncbi:hypothetical protein P154DRAFT_566914 [Amniculicola lignicola CBS 123094]|uniref:Uncharacterized protein n=1 Tax=Amniculicola lignicola CBS 123094 TaxID=1392246 RepID=A0A6A5W1F4_9PLEO|nr:hypothetical protein P154DRAFT_566914 [Amniculicola lignicola CBS 123094]
MSSAGDSGPMAAQDIHAITPNVPNQDHEEPETVVIQDHPMTPEVPNQNTEDSVVPDPNTTILENQDVEDGDGEDDDEDDVPLIRRVGHLGVSKESNTPVLENRDGEDAVDEFPLRPDGKPYKGQHISRATLWQDITLQNINKVSIYQLQ